MMKDDDFKLLRGFVTDERTIRRTFVNVESLLRLKNKDWTWSWFTWIQKEDKTKAEIKTQEKMLFCDMNFIEQHSRFFAYVKDSFIGILSLTLLYRMQRYTYGHR